MRTDEGDHHDEDDEDEGRVEVRGEESGLEAADEGVEDGELQAADARAIAQGTGAPVNTSASLLDARLCEGRAAGAVQWG